MAEAEEGAGARDEQVQEALVVILEGCAADAIAVMVLGETHPRIIPRGEALAKAMEFED